MSGDLAASLSATAPELLAEPFEVAGVFRSALARPGVGLTGHWMLHELLRRSRVYDDLVNALASPNTLTRAAAARICGAARITESVAWVADLTTDANPRVRDAAVRSLADQGGQRAVEQLMASADRIPLYRLAIALSRGASDIDIEALMRRPASEQAAVATVLACGLRRDVLRVSPLRGIGHDRPWPTAVRAAACKALGAIGDPAALDGLKRLSLTEPEPRVKGAAERAHRRLVKRSLAR